MAKLLGFPLGSPTWQWQPTLTGHDPNPPITLEDAAVATVDVGWMTSASRQVLAPPRLILSVLAFVPVVSAPTADAVMAESGGQLTPPRVMHYTSVAGPMAAGSQMSWALPPRVVPRISIPAVSFAAQPVQVDSTPTVTWISPQPIRTLIRPTSALSTVAQPIQGDSVVSWLPPPAERIKRQTIVLPSVVAQPIQIEEPTITWGWSPTSAPLAAQRQIIVRSFTAEPPQQTISPDLTWLPVIPEIARRIPTALSFAAAPPPAANLTVTEADAVATSTGPMVWSRGVIHYTAIAGPVVVPAAVTVDFPLQFNDDGMIRPDRTVQHLAVAAPVAITIPPGWWPKVDRLIRPIRTVFSQVVHPPQVSGNTTLVLGTPTVTFTAPAVTVVPSVTLALGTPTVTFISSATLHAGYNATVGAPTVTFSAPSVTITAGGTTIPLGTPTVVFSAPPATLSVSGGPGYWKFILDINTRWRAYLEQLYSYALDGRRDLSTLIRRWLNDNQTAAPDDNGRLKKLDDDSKT